LAYRLGFDASTKFSGNHSRQFLEVWNRWRGDRLMPDRKDVEPADFVALLPYFIILEVVSDMEANYRLAGTELHRLMGRELTNSNFIDLAPPEDQRERGWRMHTQVYHPCGSRSIVERIGRDGSVIVTETITLPAYSKNPDTRLILAVVSMLDRRFSEAQTYPTHFIPLANDHEFLDIGAGLPAPWVP
jgi:hypothetical protein